MLHCWQLLVSDLPLGTASDLSDLSDLKLSSRRGFHGI